MNVLYYTEMEPRFGFMWRGCVYVCQANVYVQYDKRDRRRADDHQKMGWFYVYGICDRSTTSTF